MPRFSRRSVSLIPALLLVVLAAAGLFAQNSALPVTQEEVVRVVGGPAGQPLTGAVLDLRTKEVASLLRCPVCQGLSINDSPATMAKDMKQQTRDLLAAGFTQDQILKYFEHSYGEFVRLEPPFRGVNWMVWLAPVVALVFGAILIARFLRRNRPGTGVIEGAEPRLAARNDLPDDPELARYVLKVRELAYGWPGGAAPASATLPESETL